MGQLERYGLYVLCLVIFLILGVAIWGDGTQPEGQMSSLGKGGTSLHSPDEARNEFDQHMQQQQRRAQDKQESVEALFKPATREDPDLKISDASASRGGTPRETPAPKPREAVVHVVRRNETLESISLKYYGSRHKWKQILKVNPSVSEKRMPIGTELSIPQIAGTKMRAAGRGRGKAAKSPVASGRKYTVRSGDSAWSIAERLYGKKNAYRYSKKIQQLNNISRPADLRAGVVIRLPK